MLAKSLATESVNQLYPIQGWCLTVYRWGPHGIRVNTISPGYMKTDLIHELLEREGKELVESWIKDTPLGRMAHPSELQGTIVWMASDASSFLNGSDVVSSIRTSEGNTDS